MAIKEDIIGSYECARADCSARWQSNSTVIQLNLPAENGRALVRFPEQHLDDLLDLLMEITNHKAAQLSKGGASKQRSK